MQILELKVAVIVRREKTYKRKVFNGKSIDQLVKERTVGSGFGRGRHCPRPENDHERQSLLQFIENEVLDCEIVTKYLPELYYVEKVLLDCTPRDRLKNDGVC